MNAFVVYAHPSPDSFTWHAKNAFVDAVEQCGHSVTVSDLYAMGFATDMSAEEYRREANYDSSAAVPQDVLAEQDKIDRCDALVFIYPVFWTEAPAKLVGWFDRVWTYGYAYGTPRRMKQIPKALCLCTAGHSLEHLRQYGHWAAMETVMLHDRLYQRAEEKALVVLDSMTKANPDVRAANWERHLETVRRLGEGLF